MHALARSVIVPGVLLALLQHLSRDHDQNHKAHQVARRQEQKDGDGRLKRVVQGAKRNGTHARRDLRAKHRNPLCDPLHLPAGMQRDEGSQKGVDQHVRGPKHQDRNHDAAPELDGVGSNVVVPQGETQDPHAREDEPDAVGTLLAQARDDRLCICDWAWMR